MSVKGRPQQVPQSRPNLSSEETIWSRNGFKYRYTVGRGREQLKLEMIIQQLGVTLGKNIWDLFIRGWVVKS